MGDFSIFEAVSNYIDGVRNIKNKKGYVEIILSSVLAGIFISLGAFVSVNVGFGLPVGLAKFLGGITFSAGLIMIVLIGAELFTGNILTTFHFLKDKFTFSSFFKLWILVYIGNLIGCMTVAYLLLKSGLCTNLQDKFDEISRMKISLPFIEAFIRGIFCNFLVCVAVLIGNQAKTVQGKILGIMVPITVFIISGYEHSVANMFFLPIGGASVSGFIHNIIPVTLGNIVGAWILVGILYYSYKNCKKPSVETFTIDGTLIAKEKKEENFTKV